MGLEEWDELSAQDVSQQEFDEAVKSYVDARKAVDDLKAELKPLEAEKKELENKVLSLLEATKKEKYHLAGVGLVYTSTRNSVKVPKDIEDKSKLFDYIRSKYGEESLMDYLTINSQRLNSFFNQEDELATQDENSDFRLPGVGAPVSFKQLRFKK